MKNILLLLISALFLIKTVHTQPQNVSTFESLKDWHKISSDGAKIEISQNNGYKNKGLRIDFEFTGAGWCGIEKQVNIYLPEDYKFSFYVKGNSPKNNLEFKLLDSTGDNVWWLNQRNFEFIPSWQKQVIRKRNIEFAWGPKGGGDIQHLYNIQIIISASEGGKGTIYLDELNFESITRPDTTIKTNITASSSLKNNQPSNIFDKDIKTGWRTDKNNSQWLQIDFGYIKEFGGIIIQWDKGGYAKDFNISLSEDGNNFEKTYEKKNSNGINDFIPVKNGEARFIKIKLNKSSGHGYGIKEIEIQPLEFSDHPNNFFKSVSGYYPKGFYPKYFYNIQSYWDIIGVNGDSKEGLINEEGAIEVDKGSFRIEPFIYNNGKLITWNDVTTKQSLENNYLPVPSVTWLTNDLELHIKTFAAGEKGKSYILAQYRLTNKSDKKQEYDFYLTIRPYQVNPPWQFLNMVGGASKITAIGLKKSFISVDNKKVISLTNFNGFGASEFKNGEIVTHVNKNLLPSDKQINDSAGYGSAAIKYSLKIKPGAYKDIFVAIPLYNEYPPELNNMDSAKGPEFFKQKLNEIISYWTNRLDRVDFKLPKSADKIINTLKSNLAYILINRDGPAIQPGSRSYERAWIRDGALTSSALLRLGLKDEVKEYLDWYSLYQFPNGKVPCVVDRRGADPTAENDSHGEYIFALMQYFIFTKDTAFLRDKFTHLVKAVDYIEYLINQRKTPQYEKSDSLAFYGLMPESISHEGYSAKPMHSYWDDFFTLRGLKDAVTAASILKEKETEERFVKLRNEFEKNLYSSIRLAMKAHNIDYIPGCVELGDFDATSTTISVYPGNELGNLPQPQLNNTFNKYFENFKKREDPGNKWDAYTPYEIRTAGTFLYLGEKEKTHELLNYFFNDQRPKEWNHWAEVVWHDKNEPRFIGDMPHTWIGSDYISVVRSMLVFEREYDSSLVIGMGLKKEWIDDPVGVSVKNLSTYYGNINYSIKNGNNYYTIEVSGNIDLPPGKIKLVNFIPGKPSEVIINGLPSKSYNKNEILIDRLPAEIKIK